MWLQSNIFNNGQNLTESQEIVNAFNKYLLNVATYVQWSIRYSKNIFHDFLLPININSFFSTSLMKMTFKM